MFKKYLFILFIITGLYPVDKIYTEHFNAFDIKNLNPQTIEVDISIGELILNSINLNDEDYIELLIHNSYPSKDIGSPNLPMLNKIIEIPNPLYTFDKSFIFEYTLQPGLETLLISEITGFPC